MALISYSLLSLCCETRDRWARKSGGSGATAHSCVPVNSPQSSIWSCCFQSP